MDRYQKTALVWLCAMSFGIALHASEPTGHEGSSSMEARQNAIRQVPMKLLNDQARQKLLPVLEDPSIFRRMPTQTIDSDPEMFTFLVRHPEILVNVWDIMGITNVTVERLTPFIFQGSDGAGTVCKAELIYGSDELHIYYGAGSYEGTLVGRELKGRCVCVLHSKAHRSSTGVAQVTGSMDVFLKLDNIGADLIAKTIGPFVGKTADANFVESAKFVSQLSLAAERNPVAVQQLAMKMNKVQPAVRDQFMIVAADVAKRNIQHSKSFVSTQASGDPTASSNLGMPPKKVMPSVARTLHDGDAMIASGDSLVGATVDPHAPVEEVLKSWQQQSRVPPRDLHLRSIERTDPSLRR